MQVVKKFGLAQEITFSGTPKAINTFTRIHHAVSERGYGIKLPLLAYTVEMTLPGMGIVAVERTAEDACSVTYLRGRFSKWIG
jgi:hypothetical protein